MQQFLALITVLGGDGAHPEHPIVIPPGYPVHPIAPGGQPPTATHPIAPGGTPPHPEHPIAWPPEDLHPSHPIVIPPDSEVPPDAGEPPTGPLGAVEWHTVWTQREGWIVVGIPSDDTEHVTPSKGVAQPRRK